MSYAIKHGNEKVGRVVNGVVKWTRTAYLKGFAAYYQTQVLSVCQYLDRETAAVSATTVSGLTVERL